MTGKLDGKTILIPESRELDLFAGMLESQGARTVRCPLVAIHDPDDPKPVQLWLERLIQGALDDLVLMTGEGLRRLLAAAERLDRRDEAIAAIARLRTIVRGPKPIRVLKEIGLTPGLTATTPTSAGVMETLSGADLKGRTIGLQLYPNAHPALAEFLRAQGATVVAVTPYRYASDAETSAVADVIRAMADGRIDVIAFTSSPQVKRLLNVAKDKEFDGLLATAWKHARVASIGPIVTAALEAAKIPVAAQPATNFHLKPLTMAICGLFAD